MNFESYVEKISSISQIDIARNDNRLVQKRLYIRLNSLV